MIQTLKMPTNYLRINSIILKKISTKRKQRIKKQGLLKIVYRKYLSEAADKHELTKEKS